MNKSTEVQVFDQRGDEKLTYLGEIYFKVLNGPANITISVSDRERNSYEFEVSKLYWL